MRENIAPGCLASVRLLTAAALHVWTSLARTYVPRLAGLVRQDRLSLAFTALFSLSRPGSGVQKRRDIVKPWKMAQGGESVSPASGRLTQC